MWEIGCPQNTKSLRKTALLQPVTSVPARGIMWGAEKQHNKPFLFTGFFAYVALGESSLWQTTLRLSGHRQDNAAASSRENESRLMLLPTRNSWQHSSAFMQHPGKTQLRGHNSRIRSSSQTRTTFKMQWLLSSPPLHSQQDRVTLCC